MKKINLKKVHPSWQPIVNKALQVIPDSYWIDLQLADFLPAQENLFNAFSLPLNEVKYVLFGETPYPRAQSANGYAFWDAAVKEIWSSTGFSREVNRATSLRNFLKMLLVSDGLLTTQDLSQPAIASIDKTKLIKTLDDFFQHMLQHGFLLLNASLVLRTGKKLQDARIWRPFVNIILQELHQHQPQTKLILFGKIAEMIESLPAAQNFPKLTVIHPYNYDFIFNQEVQAFFKPFELLKKT